MPKKKYGSLQPAEKVAFEKCQKLGAAVVVFDLLKIKHYNATDNAIKVAAFIPYKMARLQTLLTTFDQQVAKGFYASLP